MQYKELNTGNNSYPQFGGSNTENLLSFLTQLQTRTNYRVILVEAKSDISSTIPNIDGLPSGLLHIGWVGAGEVVAQDDYVYPGATQITSIITNVNNELYRKTWYYRVNPDTLNYERITGVIIGDQSDPYRNIVGFGCMDLYSLFLSTICLSNSYQSAYSSALLPACLSVINPGDTTANVYPSVSGPNICMAQSWAYRLLQNILKPSSNWIGDLTWLANSSATGPDYNAFNNAFIGSNFERLLSFFASLTARDLQQDDFSLKGLVDLAQAPYDNLLYINTGDYQRYAICLDYNQYDDI